MNIPFRQHHLLRFFALYEESLKPVDYLLSLYFKEHRSLGSKDRREMGDSLYGIIRWQGLLDALSAAPTWEARLKTWNEINPLDFLEDAKLPLHVRYSFPEALFNRLLNAYGEEKTKKICLASNMPAPVTVRVNTLKIDRESLLKRWREQKYSVEACPQSPLGIRFAHKMAFTSMEEFRLGLFEIQDEGSQLVAALVEAAPGHKILDYCAGAGGKTLAFAPAMANKGQVYLHDIRPWILQEAKKRLRKAGIQNAQFIPPGDKKLRMIRGHLDTVLVDVPCSGTGTLRRNPDMKWKYSDEMLERLLEQQQEIVVEAIDYLKPKGRLIYATCSILPEENDRQIAKLCEELQLKVLSPAFHSLPTPGEMDGFYGVVLGRE